MAREVDQVREQLRFFGILLATPVALFLLAALAFLSINLVFFRDTEIDGPHSPNGYQAVVQITDRGIGGDFDVDVLIQHPQGGIMATWYGGESGSDDFGEDVANSLQWTSPDTLQFETPDRERIQLRTDGAITEGER